MVETPVLSCAGLSTICFVNSTLVLNGPRLIQPQCNLHTYPLGEPWRKLTLQTSKTAWGQGTRNGPLTCSCSDKGPSLRKRQETMHYIHIGEKPRVFLCEYPLSVLTLQWWTNSINNKISVTVGFLSEGEAWKWLYVFLKLSIPTGCMKNIPQQSVYRNLQ